MYAMYICISSLYVCLMFQSIFIMYMLCTVYILHYWTITLNFGGSIIPFVFIRRKYPLLLMYSHIEGFLQG